eukprot:15341503-Ditylum_brightwellii.AAC.1
MTGLNSTIAALVTFPMWKSGVMLMPLDLQVADQSPGVALSKLELLRPQEHDCKLAHTSITALVDKYKNTKRRGGKKLTDKQSLQHQVKEESALFACN